MNGNPDNNLESLSILFDQNADSFDVKAGNKYSSQYAFLPLLSSGKNIS
jgi:hypothetical protein